MFGQASKERFRCGNQSLMIMPTAYTMPRGSSYFTDSELFIIQYTYALTNTTHISGGMIFPLSTELYQSFSVGVKQNYLQSGPLQSALWFGYNPSFHGALLGNVISLGDNNASLHAATAWGTDFKEITHDYVVMVGGMISLSPSLSAILEGLSTSETINDNGDGLITAGLRFNGSNINCDVGGARFLSNKSVSAWLPIVKVNFQF